MRWMMGALRREEGVSLVLVAVLLVVLLGFAGIAVDLGALYMERRELRNSADAAVLAIAEDCALGARPCNDETAAATAASYVDANAYDGATGFEDMVLDPAGRTIRLATYAVDSETGERGVDVPLMGIFGFDRMEVTVDAAAEWGYPAAGEGIPITVEECEFEKAGGYDSGTIVTLMFHDGRGPVEPTPETCPVGPAGQDAPGAFGWLDSPEDNCLAYIVQDTWTPNAGGGGAGQPPPATGCTAEQIYEQIYDKNILIPVHSAVQGQGQVEYWMEGFAVFHVTAYKLGNRPGLKEPDSFSCPVAQPGEDPICLQGYFTQDTLTWGETGGTNYGAVIVKLTE